MRRKILITAGGTGGHLYPAQGLAQELMDDTFACDILFVAGGLHTNRYFDRSSFRYHEVACSPLFSKNPLKAFKGGINLLRGFYQSIKILRKYRPDAVVGFGSYYAIPTLLAAKWLKIPIVLHEANSIPGKANKWFAPYADYVGVHFPFTASYLKGNVVEVGMPLRKGYQQSSMDRKEARDYFQLDEDVFTLLIFGGSQGAQAINLLIKNCFQLGLNKKIQIIHLTGNEKSVEELTVFYRNIGLKASVKAFENRMNASWIACDLFIGRSGASTIAESIEFETPGILIPYPYATDNHQEINADFFVEVVGGGLKLLEGQLTVNKLKDVLNEFLEGNSLQEMLQSIQSYKKKLCCKSLSEIVLEAAKNLNLS